MYMWAGTQAGMQQLYIRRKIGPTKNGSYFYWQVLLTVTCFLFADSGNILKVVFGTTDNGINFPIIAEKIEVRSKAWLLYLSHM